MKTKRLKRLRKAASLFCAVVMAITCAAMTIPETAYADDPTGTIVVQNDKNTTNVSIVGQTFNAYQIFTLTQDSAHSTYAYTLNSDYTDCFTKAAAELDVDTSDSATGTQYYVIDNTSGTSVVKTATLDVSDASSVRAFMDSALYEWTTTKEESTGTITGSKGGESSANKEKFANALKAHLPTTVTPSTATGKADESTSTTETATFENLALGYYLITGGGTAVGGRNGDDSVVAACILDTTTYDTNSSAYKVTVDIKVGVPTCDKNITKVDDENVTSTSTDPTSKAASGEIGDIVSFEVTSCLPNLTGYTSYTYEMTDTFSAGLDLVYTDSTSNTTNKVTSANGADKAVSVAVYGKTGSETTESWHDVTSYWTCTFTERSDTASATLKATPTAQNSDGGFTNLKALVDAYGAGAKVRFTYSAQINSSAVIGETGNPNTAKVKYSSDPSTTSESNETPDSTVKVYTFALELYKYTGDIKGVNTALAGAQFELYEASAYNSTTGTVSGNPITFSNVATGAATGTGDIPYSPQVSVSGANTTGTTLVSGSDGTIVVSGLKEGTYYLKETKAPENYNLKEDLIKVTFTTKYDDSSDPTKLNTFTADTGTDLLYKDSSGSYTTDSTDSSSNTTNSLAGLYVAVQNNLGTELPSTGGIGLTLLYIIGGLLMVVAVVSKTVKRLARDAR